MKSFITVLFITSLATSYCNEFKNGLILDHNEFKLLEEPVNLKNNNDIKITKTEDVECGLCMWITGLIEDYIAKNETETNIESSIDKLCSTLPGKYGNLCKETIEPKIPSIINFIENKETPDVICNQIKLCDSNYINEIHNFDECFFHLAIAMANTPYTLDEEQRQQFIEFIGEHC